MSRSSKRTKPPSAPRFTADVVEWEGARLVCLRGEDIHILWRTGLVLHVLRRDGVVTGIWALDVPGGPRASFIGPATVGEA